MSRLVTLNEASRMLAVFAVALSAACADSTAAVVPPASVAVTAVKPALHSIGETTQLSVAVKDADGADLEGRTVTWSSSNDAVATVSADGIVQAGVDGEATITATVDGVSGTTKVTVAQVVASIEITPAQIALRSLGETARFTGKPLDALGHVVEGKFLQWTSSAATIVATNTSGGIMAMANGQATIAATVDGVAGTAQATVQQVPIKLAFAIQPITTQAGVSIPLVVVEVRDSLGKAVSTSTSPITLAIASNPAAGTIAGTTQFNAVSGVVTYSALSIDKAGVGYTLSASSQGLAAATSSAFEIMNVPIRMDSVTLASSNLKIGGSVNYSAWITNGEGKNATGVSIQAYIIQGNVTNAAGGASVFTCSATAGTVPPGTCKADWSMNATVGTFVAGAATAKLEMREGNTLRGTITLPITIVP